MSDTYAQQTRDLIYALDIGTRSLIGIVGKVEEDKFHVLAIEKAEHGKRTMLDGQIEDIASVSQLVTTVTQRLEDRLGIHLTQVCIAAAGRALHTEQGHFELSLPGVRRITSEIVSELEAGAVSQAESKLPQAGISGARFYLVGYTVSQYLLDNYPLSTLLEHNGQRLNVEVVATFLPGEVVESLYSAMRLSNLDVVSLTLEPIAALNAAIPAELRLLNLVLADIGAGTTDIAVCRDGSVVGYTMATVAGDEISEAIMKALLVDFKTAERLKAELSTSNPLCYRDVLGLEQEVDSDDLFSLLDSAVDTLSKELSDRILEINQGSPSALFLSGGGSKLRGLQEKVASFLDMDPRRVAVAGNNFHISAFSQEVDLNDPEYATPLGIAISAGLGLIHDSYRVELNGQPAKLFRSGSLTALDILMMNGYGYADLIGRSGQTLSIIIDGERVLYWGSPATPSLLLVNDLEVPPSTIIHTGDKLSFTPARSGLPAQKTFGQALGGAAYAETALLNGSPAPADQLLCSGDVITTGQEEQISPLSLPVEETPPPVVLVPPPQGVQLNGEVLDLEPKADGTPYYLMDMLAHSGIDFSTLDQEVLLLVNDQKVPFTHPISSGDRITIELTDRT